MSTLRFLASILLGVLAAGVGIVLLQNIGTAIYPPGPETTQAIAELAKDAQSDAAKNAVRLALAATPPGAFIALLAAWTIGAGFGAFVASRIAGPRHTAIGFIIGVIVYLALERSLSRVPHPDWFRTAATIMIMVSAAGAGMVTAKRSKPVSAGSAASA